MSSQAVEIDLSDKQSEAWHYLEDKTTTEVLYGGGAGGGKSYLGCLWHIHRRIAYPGSRGMIGRAKIAALEESTLITLKNVCHEMGYVEGYDYTYNSQKHTIAWRNGSKTILKDLFQYPADPDFISLGSTEYTDAFIEEANEVTLKAFEIVNSRIRYKLQEFDLTPKVLLTCNPGPGWIKDKFIVDKDGNEIELKPYQKFVQSLVIDNPNKNFVELYTSQLKKITSDYDQRRLLLGDWIAEPGVSNPFAFNYDKLKHESEQAVFDTSKAITISIDFNIEPFAVTFSHIWRDGTGVHDHQFDEASILPGSIPAMADLIKARYGRFIQGCRITGDSMGNNRNITERDNASNYLLLGRQLHLSNSQIIVPHDPSHSNSRTDTNTVLLFFPDFKINPKTCPNTCYDLRNVQVDVYGKKVKILKADRSQPAQRADFLDCVRYKINTFHRQWIAQHKN